MVRKSNPLVQVTQPPVLWSDIFHNVKWPRPIKLVTNHSYIPNLIALYKIGHQEMALHYFFFYIFVKQSTFMIEQSELNKNFWRKKNKCKCWIMIIAEWNNDLKSNTYWYKSSNSLTLLVYNFLVPLFISSHLKLRDWENLALKDDVYHPHLKS